MTEPGVVPVPAEPARQLTTGTTSKRKQRDKTTRVPVGGSLVAPSGLSCTRWLHSKQRCCNRPVVDGDRFCVHHSELDRRPCAWCSTSIDPRRSSQHEAVCPAAVRHKDRQQWPFYHEGINLLPPPAPPAAAASACLEPISAVPGPSAKLSVAELVATVQRALACYPSLSAACPPPSLSWNEAVANAPLPSVTVAPVLGKMNRQRHQLQCAALLDLLLDRELLTEAAVVVEMGAGKAGLSHELVQDERCMRAVRAVVLIDSGAFKTKADSAMATSSPVAVQRYRMDIADLCIPRLPQLSASTQPPPHAVLIGKHLCGAALDLAISAVLHAASGSPTAVSAVCIASCCHHRCTAETYCNPAFLAQHRITARHFAALCRMSSWACNDQHQYDRRSPPQTHTQDRQDGVDWAEVADWAWEQRVRVGRDVKRLLDMGRAEALRAVGYDAEVLPFISETVTKENAAIVAARWRHSRADP